jgi:hypothetical protein
MRVDINGNVFSLTSGRFPNNFAHFFTNTLMNLDSHNHLLTYENFRKGRSIFVHDLKASHSGDCLSIDRRGNLRISIQTSQPLTENITMFIIGITSGVITINSERNIQTNFLM